MRLIDADELKVKVEAMVTHKFSESDYECGRNQAFDYVADILIDEAPTIVPIEDIKSCGVSADKSADQNVADVPSGDLISREEALDVVCKELQYQEENRNEPYDNGTCFGLKTARELLLALPSADRQTDESCRDCPLYDADKKNCPRFNKVIPQTRAEMIADRPTENFCRDCPIYSADRPQVNSNSAEEQIAEGEWIENDALGWKCSRCRIITNLKSNFCPCCGADMRGEDR